MRAGRRLLTGLLGALLVGLFSWSVVGCGAKTGLEIPDASRDSGPDAGLDAGMPDSGIPCYEIPFDGGILEVPLQLETQLARADVVFLIDQTASMGQEIDEIRNRLRDRIAPAIEEAIPDSAFGVASFADFPVPTCGEIGVDSPFRLILPVTEDLALVQAAVDSIELGNGISTPESQVEALYQLATGEGFPGYVAESFGCPMGGFGYPCFRSDALPIVLMFTDAPFHNGPRGSNPYRETCTIIPAPHTYEQAIAALQPDRIRVLGFYSGDGGPGDGREDLVQLATDTGATSDGRPLVENIGRNGAGLSTSVINAIRTFADVVSFDVDTFLVDPVPGDGIDPRAFVDRVVPVRADPMDRIEGIDVEAGTFLGVRAGTRVFFQLIIRGDAVVPGTTPRRVLLEVVFRGDGRTRLGSALVELVIPAADGTGCEAF